MNVVDLTITLYDFPSPTIKFLLPNNRAKPNGEKNIHAQENCPFQSPKKINKNNNNGRGYVV